MVLFKFPRVLGTRIGAGAHDGHMNSSLSTELVNEDTVRVEQISSKSDCGLDSLIYVPISRYSVSDHCYSHNRVTYELSTEVT